jgi:hypothetical protein
MKFIFIRIKLRISLSHRSLTHSLLLNQMNGFLFTFSFFIQTKWKWHLLPGKYNQLLKLLIQFCSFRFPFYTFLQFLQSFNQTNWFLFDAFFQIHQKHMLTKILNPFQHSWESDTADINSILTRFFLFSFRTHNKRVDRCWNTKKCVAINKRKMRQQRK